MHNQTIVLQVYINISGLMSKENMHLRRLIVILMLLSSSYALPLHGKEPARVIAGWVEKVRIENQDYEVKAKLDTGAKTSSIHATDIKSFKKDGKRWVKFTLKLKDSKDNNHEITMEKPRSRKAKIKNQNGEHDRRYVVDLKLCFNGREYVTEFTLAERTDYIYDILLGRQFLEKTAIVDSKKTFLTLAKCE